MTDESLLRRIDRVESHLAIQQLAARYALAVDGKDVNEVVTLFVEDVNAGTSWGTGREALTRFYRDALSHFYRSMHLIAGHVIAFDDEDHAHGVVHCRAEHEAGTQWGIMVMNYRDDYERQDGTWYFRRRRLQPLYTTDVLSRPRGPGFLRGWAGSADDSAEWESGRLPTEFPAFATFWRDIPPQQVAALTADPIEPHG
jgi:ketosteroid isomerase-like protein